MLSEPPRTASVFSFDAAIFSFRDPSTVSQPFSALPTTPIGAFRLFYLSIPFAYRTGYVLRAVELSWVVFWLPWVPCSLFYM